jgi:hypothetical protein
MTEPKRRGRPPKAKITDETVPIVMAVPVHAPIVFDDEFRRRQAQAYANRIWAGQSESISRHERLGRIAAALAEQGLSMEGVEL